MRRIKPYSYRPNRGSGPCLRHDFRLCAVGNDQPIQSCGSIATLRVLGRTAIEQSPRRLHADEFQIARIGEIHGETTHPALFVAFELQQAAWKKKGVRERGLQR